MTKEVTTPFRIMMPNGESTFTVHVPKHHLTNDRQFYFNHLHLAPDFFSKEADKLNLDADPEMNKMMDYPVQIRIEIEDPKDLYGEFYQNLALITRTMDVMDRINEHFEHQKPDFILKSVFFIDWTDTSLDKANEPSFYVPTVSQSYYGEVFRHALYGDRLPESVRDIDGVNNFLPPLENMLDVVFNMRIRLRIWIGPYTRVTFSSLDPFVSDLGFKQSDFGDKTPRNQYQMVNDTEFWKTVTADVAPKKLISKKDFRIYLASHSDYYSTPMQVSRMIKRDWLNDAKVTSYLTQLFDYFSRLSNVRFAFGYKPDERQFYFSLPNSDKLGVVVSCLPDFAVRLGFGPVHFVTKGMQSLPQKEAEDGIVQAQRKALALVYDTGPIVCTLDQVASNTTSGTEDQFMAVLYPDVSGILSMPQSTCSCKANAVHLQVLTQSNAALVPITFRLLRIYDNEKSANFQWKNDAYVYGVLQGFVSHKL